MESMKNSADQALTMRRRGMKIGFLGLGTMGKPMAANLVKAGYRVRVWNRSPDSVSALVAQGAVAGATPRDTCAGADVVISMLSDDAATRAVMMDAGGLEAMKPGAIHINMATISVACAVDLEQCHREKGVRYVSAPVLGRVNVAEAGQLNILTAGESATLRDIQPVFDILGQKTWIFGDRPEQANAVKLAVNTMIASAISAMGEGIALSQGYGIAKADFIDLITSTLFAAPVYKGYGAAIAENRYEPAGFKLSLGLKDVRLTMEAAENVRVPLPIASVLRDNHLDSLAHGEGHWDWAALARVSTRRAAQP
ncbi:3-hydroxyisobutyrate dehydrogenase-related protein [Granulibacter bethesdensis]|uniref:NAD(P)-dependent oxidoreductase n=1 Tax=Granulibacter bethesdensis TaxID=364410 RepID=UPI00090C690C|nr:3-hydroxyisobutyrate dehydrogenase-related protein [Granulibacter bethesdensis]